MRKILLILVALPVILFSCQKDTIEIEDVLEGLELKSDGAERDGNACFEIQFPLTVIMPDDSEVEGDSNDELRKAIKVWHKKNRKEGKGKIKLKYPLSISFRGVILDIINEDQLKRVKYSCGCDKEGEGNGDRDRDRDGKEEKTPCIEFIYPLGYTMSDGTIINAIDGKDLREKMGEWMKNNPDSKDRGNLNYPVNIKFKGEEKTVESERQMGRYKQACAGDKDAKACFVLVYPVSYTMPDKSVLKVNGKEEQARAFKRWYKANPEMRKSKPKLLFPIQINYGNERGDRILDVADAEALKKAHADCDQ